MHYKTGKDGEWVTPVMKGYKLMCCDCRLVHTFDFKITKQGRRYKIQFRASRNYRSTAAARRNLKRIVWKR